MILGTCLSGLAVSVIWSSVYVFVYHFDVELQGMPIFFLYYGYVCLTGLILWGIKSFFCVDKK